MSPSRRAFPSEHLSHRQVMETLEKEPKERKDPCSAAWLSSVDCRRSATIELPLVAFSVIFLLATRLDFVALAACLARLVSGGIQELLLHVEGYLL